MKRLILTILLAVAFPSMVHAFFGAESTYSSLSEMTDAMAKEMRGKYTGRKLYIKPDHVTDAVNGGTLPLSELLASELERSFSKAGFAFEVFLSEHIDFEIHATYHRSGEILRFNLRLSDIKQNGSYRKLENEYVVAVKSLPDGWDRENLDNRIARLAQHAISESKGQVIYLNPIVEKRKRYSSEFGEYVQIRLKSIFSNNGIKLVEQLPSSTQSPATSKRSVQTLETSDAARAGANALLDGGFLKQGDKGIFLALTLKDLSGKVLSSADDTIPRSLVTYSLDNDDADIISEIADVEHEQTGNMVRISTTKGGGYQVYREGDMVSFTIQVTKPLYLYIYDINPKGEVSLLHPKKGEPEILKKPGVIYNLPDAADTWEIKVEPPFGKDLVKVFASDRLLPIPNINNNTGSRSFEGNTRALARVDKIQNELAKQTVINGRDLIDYYKGIAARVGATLFESSVFVETRAK
jgi:hypothetical protein